MVSVKESTPDVRRTMTSIYDQVWRLSWIVQRCRLAILQLTIPLRPMMLEWNLCQLKIELKVASQLFCWILLELAYLIARHLFRSVFLRLQLTILGVVEWQNFLWLYNCAKLYKHIHLYKNMLFLTMESRVLSSETNHDFFKRSLTEVLNKMRRPTALFESFRS